MSEIQVFPVRNALQKRRFLTFPWKIYENDPLWVPPLLPERKKTLDPKRGLFFRNGYAESFIAWRKGTPVGTIVCAEDTNNTQTRGFGECMIGFFECVEDYQVAEALFDKAAEWAHQHNLVSLYGTYNLDREESRGILIEGRDRPPVSYCGHTPAYYPSLFERYGFHKDGDDGLAYAIEVNLDTPEIQHMMHLAERIRQRKNITIRSANLKDIDGEIDRVVEIQNRGLAHFDGFTPYTHTSIEAMILPVLDIADPELVLFAEVDGKSVGWFPGVPNMNEVLIHLNGLRHPWDTLRLLRYGRLKPRSLAVKSVAVFPEYWDTGVGVLLFAEMARRASAKGYTWIDLSLTGENNSDTFPLAHRLGAKIYKRYRFYCKELAS